MSPSRLELTLGAVILVLWIWALVWVHGLGRLRGPLNPPSQSEMARILDELPLDPPAR